MRSFFRRPPFRSIFLCAALAFGSKIESALADGFSISGASVTLANSAELITTGDFILTAGTVTLNTSKISLGGSWTNTGGVFVAGTSTVAFTATAPGETITTRNKSFNHVMFTGAGYWTLQDSMTLTGTLSLSAGTLDTNSSNNYGISVSSGWILSGSGVFTPNLSTVTFQGITSTSTLTGSTTFYSLQCITPGKTLSLASGSTQTVTGSLILTGTGGNLVLVRSTTASSAANLTNTGANTVTFTRAVDSNAANGITILAGATSSNGTGNTNWLFAAPTLSVTLSTHSYNFGSVALGATTISTTALTVTNSGTATQTYSLSVTTTGAQTVWGVDTATPTIFDQFAMFGAFNSVQPSSTTFVIADILTSTPTASSAAIFAVNQTGLHVPVSAVRNLWLRLDMPPTSSTSTQQQMNVTVTASAP